MKIKFILSMLFILLAGLGSSVSAQLLNEDFSYPVGDSVAIHGWPVSSAGANPILITSPGLTFNGYPGSNVGNAVHLTTTGQDVRKGFKPDSVGSMYAAFMVKVDSTKIGAGDYFFAFTLFDSPTSIYGRVFAKSTTGGFLFGLGKNNETTQPFGTTVFSFNTTYLVVLKYTFVPGDTNDVVTLYVLPQGASLASEPATAEVGPYKISTKGDARNLGAVTLRQGSNSTAAALTLDGVRVDSTWTGVTTIPSFPENFDYAAGDSLTQHGWLVNSGGTTNAILTTAPGLTFPNYPLSGIGNAATLTTSGQDVYKAFPKDSGGSFYSTFMLKVTAAQAGGDYFFGISPAEAAYNYYGRLFIKSSGTGFQFGLSKSNETAMYGSTVFNFNTTYLAVVKYSFDPAKDSNDVVKLYVLPSGAALTAEPAVAEISDTAITRADAKNFSYVALRQGSATNAASLVIDGIRVEKSWYKAMGVPTLENFYSVGTGSVAGEKAHFASLKSALDSLSHGMPIPSNTTFYITSDITEPQTGGFGIGLAVDPTPYSVTFKPAVGVKPVITLQYAADNNEGPAGALLIGANGATMKWTDLKTTRNIIFDGSNSEGGKSRDLTIQTTGATRNAIPMVIVGDVQNVTVKNCNILYKVTPAAGIDGDLLDQAVVIRTATATNTGAVEKVPSKITLDNNWISANFPGATQVAGGVGGYLTGTPGTYPSAIVIRNNKIEGVRHGVAISYLGSTDVYNNEIITNQSALGNLTNEGVLATNTLASATYNVYANKITKLAVRDSSSTTGGIAGISIEGRGTFNINNNMISGFALVGSNTDKNAYLYGIRVADSAVANIYYNTIRMDSLAPIGTGTVNYRGLYFTNGINTVKNNIVANYEDDFASVDIYRGNNGTPGTLAGTLTADYNDYHRASTSNALTGFKDTTKATTMTAWRSLSGVDANSLIGAPGFVSATDLHIDTKALVTPVISNAGVPIAGILTDIDGEARNATTPDIGADEFTMVPVAQPIPVVTIGEARKDLNNDFFADHSVTKDTLTVYGVITTVNFSTTSGFQTFMQDATGGMMVYSFDKKPAAPAEIGDSIKVTGIVAQYKGVVEFTVLMDSLHYVVIKKNAVVPAPKRLSVQQFGANSEAYEGQLIEIDSLFKSSGTWPAKNGYASVYVKNLIKKDSVQMFVSSVTDLPGAAEPTWPVNAVGVVSQYSSSAVPNDGYELMPRSMSDIKAITITDVAASAALPTTFELMNNYPNPFNPSTVIRFALPQQSVARLIVYDLLGREVRTLVNGMTNAGYFETTWNGRNNAGVQVSSGIYIYRMEAGSFISSKKMMLLK
ncbi:MAG TPA: FlgD immunoglobulin-like domain containing protein [Bacteroidota bacterium]|nr:FlgD immunoglobulin-like domain containing protein [Bacteroidota bacterium]